jgi:hypothetical protein
VLNVVAGLAFAAFVALGLLAGRARDAAGRQRRVSVFLAFAAAVSFGAGLSQRDAWPFSSWPLAASAPGRSVTYSTVAAVDRSGGEYAVDYRAWQPLGFDELLSWIQLEFPKLQRAEQDEAARYLLGLAEAARSRAVAEGRVGYFDRFLGPLAAPDFLLHPALWTDHPAPSSRFVKLRVYSETLVLDDPARGGGVTERTLDYESP